MKNMIAKYGRPIAALDEELDMESEQPRSSRVPFRRRWSAGFELLLYFLALFQFVNWAGDAVKATEGVNAVLRYGCALVAMIFVLICLPLLAYEFACWVVLRPWNKDRILQSLQSDQRAADEMEAKTA
jgi:uncharacterized membrane protein YcjF (UPF0283 family)